MNRYDDYFKQSLTVSVAVHFVILLIFIFGIPSWFEKLPDEQQIITFEMVDVSDIANIKTQNTTKQDAIEAEDARKIVQTKKPQEEEPEETKKEEKQPEPEKKDAEEVPTPKEQIKKKEEKKKPEKKDETKKDTKKKDDPKKDQKKKPKKTQNDSIDDILKTLEDSSEGNSKSNKKNRSASQNDGKFAKGNNFNEDSPLSITEMLLVRNQLEKNWNPPVGIKNLDEVVVRLHLSLEPDGTVKDVKIIKTHCPNSDNNTCNLVSESALRAARKASPIQNLPPHRYNIWKEFDVDFDPSSIAE